MPSEHTRRHGGTDAAAPGGTDTSEGVALRDSQLRLAVQYAVSHALAEAETLDAALSAVLREIGTHLGWCWGAFWMPNPATDTLRMHSMWQARPLTEFERVTRATELPRSGGLPGRVWATGAPAWVTDIRTDDNFPRHAAAVVDGLRGAFAFPVVAHRHILGVMEFYSDQLHVPDAVLLNTAEGIGYQIGHVIVQQHAIEAQRIAEVRKATILETALDGIIKIDAAGRIIEFNPAAEAMFGYSRAAVVGQPMVELIVPPSLREAHRRGMARYLATGEAHVLGRRIEILALRAGGAEFPVELAIARVPLPGPPIFTAYLRDLTERKRLEAEREQLLTAQIDAREQLESQAMELEAQAMELETTAEELRDTNQRLRQAVGDADRARHIAEAANQTKSNFLAMMSHELRTPLTAIIGYEELLADGITGPVTATQGQQLHRIKVSADHLLFLIDQVLTLSQIELGKEDLAMARVRVATALETAGIMIEPLVVAKGLTLTLSNADDALEIETDAGKLQQILLNLLSNAVKYTQCGDVHLSTGDAGTHVVFSVADTGIGIAPEHVEQIFDPFWQVEQEATHRRYGGTGLGLHVTRRLAGLLGGEVMVDSVLGRGSTFVVRLPKRRV